MATSDDLNDFNEEAFYQQLLLEETKYLQKKAGDDSIEFIPDPGFVLKSKISSEGREKKVFVNICTSKHIPKAKEVTEKELAEILDSEDPMRYRVPLSLGEPHAEIDKSGNGCTVYDIVIHPSFLKKVQENSFFQNFFLTVVFQGLEEKYGLELDRNWTILKNKKSMGKVQSHFIRNKSKPVIMDMENNSQNTSQPVVKDGAQPNKIQEIEPDVRPTPEPKYRVLIEPPEGVPEFVVLEISLPGVKSAKVIDLDVSGDRLVLQVNTDLYRLDIQLPHDVDNEECGAQFNKKTK
ncbi:PIH1 domain-containing protein 1-like, partial [Actinia tenebrosa]|uniref:PIH1 domain-containing protein 1 n=1 Tax=Actinia tenebrosa TaxID=6105 RepID=A0A6P8H3I2_ACTTE